MGTGQTPQVKETAAQALGGCLGIGLAVAAILFAFVAAVGLAVKLFVYIIQY